MKTTKSAKIVVQRRIDGLYQITKLTNTAEVTVGSTTVPGGKTRTVAIDDTVTHNELKQLCADKNLTVDILPTSK